MSIEIQSAYEKDMGVIRENGTIDYVDNTTEDIIESNEVISEKAESNKEFNEEF